MTSFSTRLWLAVVAGAALGLAGLPARAQLVINDTLTGASSSYDWSALNGACLTAGNNTGTIPACVGLSYYSGKTLVGGTTGRLPDVAGYGALRLTNGDTTTGGSNGDNQTGAVVSNFTFPTDSGIQVTWTSVTYGGDNLNGTGADGISFFLADGSFNPTVGGLGGSLGYSCSNTNSVYDGVIGGYLGVGIDEYGNFSNKSDNTDTGDSVAGLHPARISVRGAGYTAFDWLSNSAAYKKYYPATMAAATRITAIKNTCRTGYAWNYSGGTLKDSTNANIANGAQTHDKLPFNYPLITTSDLGSSVKIANQEGVSSPKRGAGTPGACAPGSTTCAVPITYTLKITPDGVLDFSYSMNGGLNNPVITGQKITDSNGPLPASFRFGFSSGTGGGNNVHEITCFKAVPASQSTSSAGSNVQSARGDTDSQVFLAFYRPLNWWGSLTAQKLVYDPDLNGGSLTVNPVATWDASCVLTGGVCAATNSTVANAQAWNARNVLTWSGSAGIPFQWSNLTAAQKLSLSLGESSTSARLKFLRGDRSNEDANGGSFRNRTSVLGDIIDSSPTWVGPPNLPYEGPWADKLGGSVVEGTSYATFKSTNATRTNVVYVGANDGLLHGFRAGSYNSTGVFGGINDGLELLAYMPAQVVSSIHSINPSLDYSSTAYSHNFYVDATPGTGDLYYNGAWHTWLVGGLGPGGHPLGAVGDNNTIILPPTSAIFALDVTDPTQFSESNAASLVLGEWSSSTITCVNVALLCGSHLGQTFGTPLIRRLHDGNWAAIFGNGLNSNAGTAGIYIMHVNITTGARTFRYLDTGVGSILSNNGIVQVTAADLDNDHVTDYVYAGDIQGNVWRFDLTSTNPSTWAVGSSALFTTPSGQPISTRVTVSSVPTSTGVGLPKVIVAFGTGQKQPITLLSAETYSSASQSLYGIWDWNMSAWNLLPTDTDYDSLSAPRSITLAKLTAQTVTAVGSPVSYRTVSNTPICWFGSTACTNGNTQFGWRVALPTSSELVVYNPTTAYGMFIVNTTIPSAANALTCEATPASGFTMAIQMSNGGGAQTPFFPNASGEFVTSNIAGLPLNGTGSGSIITFGKSVFLFSQTADGSGVGQHLNPTGDTGSRLSWTKMR